jgi:hypothetical protein
LHDEILGKPEKTGRKSWKNSDILPSGLNGTTVIILIFLQRAKEAG